MLRRPVEAVFERLPAAKGLGRWLVIAGALVLTAGSVLGVGRLSVSGLDGLFDPLDEGEARYAAHREKFTSSRQAIVLIDTGEHGEAEAVAQAAAFALGESLEDEPKIAAVHWGLDPLAMPPKLIRTLPADDMAARVDQIKQLRPLLESPDVESLLRAGMAEAIHSATRRGGDGSDADLVQGAKVFVALIDALTRRMQTPADEPVDLWQALVAAAGQGEQEEGGFDWQLLRSASGRLLVLRVELLEGVDDRPGLAGSVAALRRQVETVRLRFPGVEMGVTGLGPTALEAQRVLRAASMRAVGGAGIALLLLSGLAWRSAWLPLVVAAVAGSATLWTLGAAGWALGTINPAGLYGVAGAAVLSGFGGLTLAGAWARGRDRGAAAGLAGPGLVLAGLVVAGVGVFVACGGHAWLGEAQGLPALIGMPQAGLVLVLGVVAAWAAVLGLGPALLREARGTEKQSHKPRGEMALRLSQAAADRPGLAWLVAGTMVAGVGAWAWTTPGSLEFTSLTPRQIEGARWQQRALVQGGEWGLPLACVARGMQDAAELTTRLRALPEVGAVAGIGRLIPQDPAAVDAVLASLDAELGAAARQAGALPTPSRPPDDLPAIPHAPDPPGGGGALVNQVRLVRVALGFLPATVRDQLGGLADSMLVSTDRFVEASESLPAAQRSARSGAMARDYDDARRRAGTLVSGMVDPAPLTGRELRGVGGGLFNAWVLAPAGGVEAKDTAEMLLKISPALDAARAPTAAELRRFRRAVQAVDGQVTGSLERQVARGQRVVRAVVGVAVGAGLVFVLTAWLFGAGGRAGLGGGVAVAGSAATLGAGVGWLGQSITPIGWALWPVVGLVVVCWGAAWVTGGGGQKAKNMAPRGGAGAEAFGLLLATGFVAAAGLRSALADGLTATAVAACLAIGLSGLWVLLLVNPTPWSSAKD